MFNKAPVHVAKRIRTKAHQGINRFEAILVVIMLAILASLAIPAYLKQVEKYRFSEVDSSFDRYSIEYLAQTAPGPSGDFGQGSSS